MQFNLAALRNPEANAGAMILNVDGPYGYLETPVAIGSTVGRPAPQAPSRQPDIATGGTGPKGTWASVARRPVEHLGDRVVFDPSRMVTGEPYPFRFRGHPLIAVRRGDGSLDVYYLPAK
ncbi:MAG: hypothetical protein ACYDCI_07030 [Candidatus Limnocylindrales bacterium]